MINYEVFCFIFGNGCVQKEYFETYAEAEKFQDENLYKAYDSISITPLNETAFKNMK